ncbi:MAG: hypothetical protein ACK5N8_06350 [Alphaproteobacteria bacterium]
MKKFLLAVFLVTLLFASPVVAKFNPPKEGYRKVSDKMTDGYFRQYNTSEDGKMTLEQFQARDINRQDRRSMRKDQKSGIYQTDEEKFKEMDEDGDGFVTKEEMNKYISKTRGEGREFY